MPDVEHPPLGEVTITPMKARHLKQVLEIEKQVYPRPWSRSLFLSEIALRSSRSYFVALHGGSLVGYGGVMMNGDEGHVTNVAVDPGWQHRSIATRILLQLTADALRRGAHRVTLEVRASNRRAQRLYAWFGYMPVAIRKGYYLESHEDAVVMTAYDIDDDEYLGRLRAIADTLPSRTIVIDDPPW